MKYDIIVTGFKTNRAKTIIIRQLAHDPSLSLQKATEMVEAGPVILFKNLDVNEVKIYTEQLTNVGIIWKAAESDHDNQTHKSQVSIPPQPAVLDSKPQNTTESDNIKKHDSTSQSHLHQENHNPVIFSRPEKAEKKKAGWFELEPENKNVIPTLVFFSLVVLIIAGVIAIDKSKKNEIKLKKMTVYSTDPVKPEQKSQSRTYRETVKKDPQLPPNDVSRKDISSQQKTESSAMVDSAMQVKNDYSKEIYFYKLAIAFNRYNINAWYGLLNAYKDSNMKKEMDSTKQEMIDIFGDAVFSIKEIISHYGKLNDAQLDKDGNYLIEYNTEKSEKNELIDESYYLVREIRQVCKCKQISLFAKTGPGRGLIVHISSSAEIASFEQYKNFASITYLN